MRRVVYYIIQYGFSGLIGISLTGKFGEKGKTNIVMFQVIAFDKGYNADRCILILQFYHPIINGRIIHYLLNIYPGILLRFDISFANKFYPLRGIQQLQYKW